MKSGVFALFISEMYDGMRRRVYTYADRMIFLFFLFAKPARILLLKAQQKLDIRFSFDLGYIRISGDAIALGYKYWTPIKVVT